jgi:translation elongation factor EF-4
MNPPSFDILTPSAKTQIEIRDLIDGQLKTAEIQSKTSEKQYKSTIILAFASVFIGLISLKPILYDGNVKINESIILLTKSQAKYSETISKMSLTINELQNKVRILQDKNEMLANTKKIKK